VNHALLLLEDLRELRRWVWHEESRGSSKD